jgi:hypothetical protein
MANSETFTKGRWLYMKVVVYMPGYQKRFRELREYYPTLHNEGEGKRVLVIFSPIPPKRIPEGRTRWETKLPVPVPESCVRVFIQARPGMSDVDDRYATVVCSPEGALGVGERWGEVNCLCPIEATSIRAYQRKEEVQFTVKEYLIRELTGNSLKLEVVVSRGTFNKIQSEFPQYATAMRAALAELSTYREKASAAYQ